MASGAWFSEGSGHFIFPAHRRGAALTRILLSVPSPSCWDECVMGVAKPSRNPMLSGTMH